MNGRNTDLKSVLFPVETQEVYLRSGDKQNHGFKEVEGYRAVVDVEKSYVFSIVSPKYRLVTNQDAFNLGKDCFRQVFSDQTLQGLDVFNIIQPSTRSFCHIDLFHRSRFLDDVQVGGWLPFLRITNSYNRTKPLRFDLGFCRKVCMNGLVRGERSITYRYYHTKGELGESATFNIDFSGLKRMEAEFVEQLHNLKRYHVPEMYVLPLICKGLGIAVRAEDFNKPKKVEALSRFYAQVQQLTETYFSEMGQNGYATLNVITDIASRPILYISNESMIDPLQRKSSDWMSGFIHAIEDKKFTFEDYLNGHLASAQMLSNHFKG